MIKNTRLSAIYKELPLFVIGSLILITIVAIVFLTRPNNHADSSIPLPKPALKDLAAQKKIELGNFAMPKLLHEKAYNEILTQQFSFVLLDNQPNWHFTDADLRPSQDAFNFSRIDEVVNYAEKNNMPIQAHHYVWGDDKWLPDWLKNGNYNKEQLLDLIHKHIATVGGHYAGKIREWTVVNEAFTRQQHLYGLRDWWADHIGDQSYIDQSFIWARQADPNSKLILNDFGNESINQTSNLMYDYVSGALKRGIPIDGIGMQMHIDGTHPPTKDEVVANMRRFGDLGIKVYVTEFDVNMHDLKVDNASKDRLQADIYYEMLRACIESQVCQSFAYLGITDKETWYNYLPNTPNARPLMFDKNYLPKPAFYSTRDALTQP